jgi:hypothetical protein
MKYIGVEREEEAIDWAKSVLKIENPVGFCRALSAVDSNGDFLFVVVLSNFTETNVDMHTAAVEGAEWASPKEAIRMFRSVFEFAFERFQVLRVTGLVRSKNTAARRFDEHIGFKLEGVMRRAFKDDDLCIYGFLVEDFYSHNWYRGQK